jgi:hypothetical protein
VSKAADKIAAGLAARDRKAVIPLSNLKGAPATSGDLNELAAQIELAASRVGEIAEGFERAVEDFTTRKRAELARLGRSADERGVTTDSLGDDQRGRMLREAVRAERRRLLEVGVDDRERLASGIREKSARIAAVADMWADPVAILKRATLGSERADRFRRDLESSGPVEVENALRHAVLTGDRDLAAAALQRVDAMPRASRDSVRISRREVAENLVAEEWTRARRNILVAEIGAESAAVALAGVEGRDVPSSRKIALGLKRRELSALSGEGETEDAA